MNVRTLGITVSLLANVGLMFALLHRSPPGTSEPSAVAAPVTTLETKLAEAAGGATAAEAWPALSAGSIPEVISRLRAAGFPPKLQRTIVRALVAKQFAARHRAIADMIKARPWWTPMFMPGEGAKVITARHQLQREENDAVEALLGRDPDDSEYVRASRKYRYGDLPPATLADLDRINGDYGELADDIRNTARGLLLAEDREKLLYLERQAREDIARLLSPDELFEYDLRSSPTGWWLRQQLGPMNVSEEEFRAIFRVQSELVAPFAGGNYQLMSPEVSKAWLALAPQLKEQIKSVLSPERYAEYELKTDPSYQPTEALVKRLQLPPAAVAEILAVQKEIQKRADAVNANSSLSPALRSAQLGALADEAAARLSPALGAEGLTAYQQSAGGWLNALRPSGPINPSKS